MTFSVDKFVTLRPAVYHVTDPVNLPRLARLQRLEPAADLLRQAGRTDLLTKRRDKPEPLRLGSDRVTLKDQTPLRIANVKLADGWTERDLVAFLNEHVFFWPGDNSGPIKHGQRLLEHYRRDALLRIPTAALLDANPRIEPLFCAFNSGAPRKQHGLPVPRGPDLFCPARTFARTAGKVIELVFRAPVILPSASAAAVDSGDWIPLANAAA